MIVRRAYVRFPTRFGQFRSMRFISNWSPTFERRKQPARNTGFRTGPDRRRAETTGDPVGGSYLLSVPARIFHKPPITLASLGECAERLADDLAGRLGQAVAKRGGALLAVSGGRTPEHIFPVLGHRNLPWERIVVTLADERWVAPGHADSNEGLTRRLLLRGPASKARFAALKTDHRTPADGRLQVEAALAGLHWPLDAVYLGMGQDGHIASLFPGGEWSGAPGRALAVDAGGSARISLTPGALLDSRHIFLVIAGPDKRATLEAAMQPGPPEQFPVRLILHQDRVPVTIYAVA